nr:MULTISPECIES: IS4 family transposase [Myxococcaceae]
MRRATQRTQAAGSLAWARQEFGSAVLGDKRRTERGVQLGAAAATRPHGKLTVALRDAAARQAGYDFVESPDVSPGALREAAARAAWKRAGAAPLVYVPLDQSTLTLPEASWKKGFGWVDNGRARVLGAETLNAPLLSGRGVPLGLVGHVLWCRRAPPRPRGTRTDGLALEDKETRYWLQVAQSVVESWQASGFAGTPWLQLDAGADAREVLEWMAWSAEGARVTVRCAQRTRLCEGPEGEPGHLEDVLLRQAPRRPYRLRVLPSEKRHGRRARMVVRFCSVLLHLTCPRTGRTLPVQAWAVHAREEGTCPQGEEPLDWLLLTNTPVRRWKDALAVVRGYALRWRVEEVHRAWKRTGCQVEASALHLRAFECWALMLLCVAVRIERLKRLAREAPDTPADTEFSPYELRALFLLTRNAKAYAQRSVPTLGEAVRWLAELGGYTGKSSGGPPGSVVLRRGLEQLGPTAEALRFQEQIKG